MAAGEESNTYPSSFLWDAGWRQGTLFRLPGAAFFWNAAPQPEELNALGLGKKRVRDRERLVLISQECDILSNDEPRVEALLVRVRDKPSDRRYLARIANNSFREFVLDMDTGFVADARTRLQIAKEILYEVQPEQWTMSDSARDEFVDWLAGRYDRPPIPTSVYEAVCRPIRQLIERMKTEDQEAFATLDRSIQRIRVRVPESNSPPLNVGLLLILEDDIDEDGALAVENAEREIRNAVGNSGVHCNLEIESKPYGIVLLSEHDATRPLDLDYMTDKGDEMVLPAVATESL